MLKTWLNTRSSVWAKRSQKAFGRVALGAYNLDAMPFSVRSNRISKTFQLNRKELDWSLVQFNPPLVFVHLWCVTDLHLRYYFVSKWFVLRSRARIKLFCRKQKRGDLKICYSYFALNTVIKSRMNSKGVWVSKAKVLKSLDILLYLICLLSESWCLQNNRTLFHRRLQHKGKIFHWDLHEGFRMCQSSVLNCSSFWFTETKKKTSKHGI